jgi:hypothetical protein
MANYIILKNAVNNALYIGRYTKNITTHSIQKTVEKKFGRLSILCEGDKNIDKYDNIQNITKNKITNFTIIPYCKENDPIYIESLKQGIILKKDDKTSFCEINVCTLTGKKIMLLCKQSYTIPEIKYLIAEHEGVPIDQQRIIFAGKQYDNDDNATLAILKIQSGANLHLVLRLRGGMFTQSTSGQIDYNKIDKMQVDFDFDESYEEEINFGIDKLFI